MIAPMLRNRYKEIRSKIVSRLIGISRRIAVIDVLVALIEVCALALVLLVLIHPMVTGKNVMLLGSFVMVFEAFRRGQGYMSSMIGCIGGLYENKLFVNNLFEFLSLQPSVKSPQNPVNFPKVIEVIELRDVTFAYPEMQTPVLKNFNFTARRNEVTYLSGANGMGKTTILKLILRLYDPVSGGVYVNGINIKDFDLRALRQSMSVMFQDFVQYCFTVEEIMSFGNTEVGMDEERMKRALCSSSADTVVNSLPQGIHTMLGRQFDNGTELSMGQWQRIVLARQLYSNAQVMLFDEPTAWLDSQSKALFSDALEEVKKERVVVVVKHSEN